MFGRSAEAAKRFCFATLGAIRIALGLHHTTLVRDFALNVFRDRKVDIIETSAPPHKMVQEVVEGERQAGREAMIPARHHHFRHLGIKIAGFFIGTMVVTSVASRALRSTELRISEVKLDDQACTLLSKDDDQVIHLVAHWPRVETEAALDEIDRKVRDRSSHAFALVSVAAALEFGADGLGPAHRTLSR